jgi:hypothetical protein
MPIVSKETYLGEMKKNRLFLEAVFGGEDGRGDYAVTGTLSRISAQFLPVRAAAAFLWRA